VVLGIRVSSVNVSTKVLLRDGISLILCEIVLIVLINGQRLYWWHGFVLVSMYIIYLTYMLTSMKRSSEPDGTEDESDIDDTNHSPNAINPKSFYGSVFYWLSLGPLMNLEGMFVKEKQRQAMKDENWNGWPMLLASTGVICVACWLLVKACEWLGTGDAQVPYYTLFGQQFTGLGMPAMFVAVIFASMATSVPDTVISIRDARDGDYDDAVANALGSNIFDICFALGFPLFLYSLIHGPIEMSPTIAVQSGELRLLLLGLTIIGFFIYYIGKRGVTPSGKKYVELKRGKAFLLLSVYGLFVLYIIGRSQGAPLAEKLSGFLQSILVQLPSFG
jgi:cation:H+ antiporter